MVVITNYQFTASITFHDVLHGFQVGRGTGTATLKAKIIQELATMRQEVIYVIFMELHKVYAALDRDI